HPLAVRGLDSPPASDSSPLALRRAVGRRGHGLWRPTAAPFEPEADLSAKTESDRASAHNSGRDPRRIPHASSSVHRRNGDHHRATAEESEHGGEVPAPIRGGVARQALHTSKAP